MNPFFIKYPTCASFNDACFKQNNPGFRTQVQGPKGTFEYLGCGDFWFRDGRGMLSACHLGMVAAGSGITPILQILRQIFGDPDDGTEVQMVDVNSSEADIIVRDELDALTRHFPGRFSVCHVLSRMPDVLPDGLLCVKGPLNLEILANQLFHPGDSTMVLVCGPPKLVSDVCRPALAKLGHDPSRIVIY